MRSKSLLLSIIVASGIIGCSSSGGGQSDGGSSTPGTTSYNEVPLTISAPSIIPVLGKNSTNTVMFVHNNTTKSISNISYSVLGSNNSNKIIIDPQSADGCSVIPAGGVCRVGIVTPIGSSQGSNLIQAQYQNPNNKAKTTYTQLFQYQEMNNLTNGVPFTTNTGSLALDGKGKGSRALYYYIPGSSTYKVSTSTSSPAITIRDRTLADNQEAIGNITVFAYDIDVPLSIEGSKLSSAGSYLIEVDTQSSSDGKKFSSVELGAQTVATTPIISLGLASVANSTSESQIQIPVFNSGTATATQVQASLTGASTGATILDNNCASELTANSGCLVTVAIPQNSTNTDNLRVTYAPSSSETLSSANTSLAWYKSGKEPVIGYNYTLPTFYSTQGTNLDVTLTNQIAGSLAVTVQSIQFVPSASSATATASVNLTTGLKPCSSNVLSAGNSCTFSVNINDSQVQSGNGVFLLTGKKPDGRSYTRYLNINYVASSYNSLLALTSSEPAFKVLGDSASISSKVFTLINTGAAPAVLESFVAGENVANVQTSWFSTKESGGPVICKKGVTLNQGDSCNFTIAIGPVAYSSIAAPLTDTGLVPVKVTYYQTGAPDLKSTSNLYDYTISANSQDVSISNFSITGAVSGDGSQATPAVFKGSDTSAKTVSIEYTNTGTNPISIISLNNTANPFMWSLGGTCTASTTLQPGAKCTITYTSVVATYANSGYSGYSDNTNMNITTPEIALKDNVTGEIFVSSDDTFPTPINSKTLYANTQLAKVTNSVAQGISGNTLLYQTITNATGYGAFQITFDAENYFNNPVAAVGCNFTSTDTVLSQSCTVSGNGTFSPTLQNASWAAGALLNVNFGISGTNGQAVLNTPTFVQSAIQLSGNEAAE